MFCIICIETYTKQELFSMILNVWFCISESFVFIHHLDSFEEYRCEGDIRIDGETEVFVTYSGGKIDSLCYVMGIMGRDAQNLKRYRLCLETLVYSDPDCELLVGLIGSDPQVNITFIYMNIRSCILQINIIICIRVSWTLQLLFMYASVHLL